MVTINKLIIIICTLLLASVSHADCRGCCSRNKGVVCSGGVTQCGNGTPLSVKCKAKSCNKCSSAVRTTKAKAAKVSQVKTTANKYSRKSFPHWKDEDRNCRNTRAEILIKHNIGKLKFKTDKKCVVISGKWIGPYSGKTFTKANDLDVDHIIPLKKAYSIGANSWVRDKRELFANDYENLLPVWKRLNRQKGAKGPLRWVPPLQSYRCEYLRRWNYIKTKYNLKSPGREIASIDEMSKGCKPVPVKHK
jgi:hypothetical protein